MNSSWALISTLAVLAALITYLAMARGGGTHTQLMSFRRQTMHYELTQNKAVRLNRDQIAERQPLVRMDTEMAVNVKYEPPMLRDIVLSMAQDYQESLDKDEPYGGLCAMHYNLPVSVCYIPQIGNESGVLMFNLEIVGYAPDYGEGQEWSNFCQRGQQAYGVTRFVGVWIEYYDDRGRRVLFWAEEQLGRIVQHLYWLNRGVLPCSLWSPQKQADALFQIKSYNVVSKDRS